MNKRIKLITIVVTLSIIFSATAFATNADFTMYGIRTLYEDTSHLVYGTTYVTKNDSSASERNIQTKHSNINVGNWYNNLFYVVRQSDTKLCQSKWLTPGANYVPISNSSLITKGNSYTVAVRGNTLYAIQNDEDRFTTHVYLKAK